ncbi:hypothetical protein ACFX2G_028340 [Malus domestica]
MLKKIKRPAVADLTNQYFEQSGLCFTGTAYHVMQFIDSSTKRLFNRPRLLVKSFLKKRSCWWIRSFATILTTILHYPFIKNAGVSVRDFYTAKLTAEINFPLSTSRACWTQVSRQGDSTPVAHFILCSELANRLLIFPYLFSFLPIAFQLA